MKRTGQFIIIFCFVILLSVLGACSGKTQKAAKTDTKDEVTTTEAPEGPREYKNNMTEAEKSKLQTQQTEFGDEISFYDEEIDSPYVFDLLKGSTYDGAKESALYVILGTSFDEAQLKALDQYLDTTATQTVIAVQNTKDVTDIKSMSERDYVKNAPAFQTFLIDNMLGCLCESYKINTKQICISGYEVAGYFAANTLFKGNPSENYLIISPEMFKKVDNLDIVATENAYFTSGNTSLPANVCLVRAEEDKNFRASGKTDEWVKSLNSHAYQGFVVNDLVLPGVGHNTMDVEALLRGICYFSQTEYGDKEKACVDESTLMTQKEKDSITVGKLSKEQEFYDEVVTADPAAKDYINEISMYDEEINDTFLIHLSLPEDYDKTKQYPLVLMTDGVWRLSDHPQLRKMMKDGEVEDVILVSVGYPRGYDYTTIRVRDLVDQPDLFLQFLVDNLMPYLCENYSVDKSRVTLTGHSYGGYWGLYALFHSDTIAKNTFNSYYIGSPSVQSNTNTAFASNFEKWYYERKQDLNCSVYVTVGGDEEPGFINMIESFLNGMKEHTYQGLNMEYEVIDGYSHDTVFKPSIKNMMLKYYGLNKK